MMRAFVCSKGRAETITTHQVLDRLGVACTVVVHNHEQAERYVGAGVPAKIIEVSGVLADHYGLTRQREFVCRNLVQPGEWFIFADDNIRDIHQHPMASNRQYPELPGCVVGDPSIPQHRKDFATPATADSWNDYCRFALHAADAMGVNLVGFATNSNPAFRARHLRYVAYVSGKLMFWHNVPFAFDHGISMEDYRNTAEHLMRYGRVMVDNWIQPVAGHYEPGGMGAYLERLPYRLQDVQQLLRQYPGLLRVKDRKGFERNTDLALKVTTVAQVERVRRQQDELARQAALGDRLTV